MKEKVTVVIPNYDGFRHLPPCLDTLLSTMTQEHPFKILVVDNGSTDGSKLLLQTSYPQISAIYLPDNTGFSHAVNVGIKAVKTPYVILLNNDTIVKPDFVRHLTETMDANPHAFSAGARMLRMDSPRRIDNAGDLYCVLGWAYARGKDRPAAAYNKPAKIFSACGGAAIYRRSAFARIGYFDESFFAYLEDVDIGYRAQLYGYQNLYTPSAQVLHAGSAASGSRYNTFKTPLAAANSIRLIKNNMPLPQILINLPFLIPGFLIKALFYARKKMLRHYLSGLLTGLRSTPGSHNPTQSPSSFHRHRPSFRRYAYIQLQLYLNLLRLITNK
jgi:GT2 family glycosyltransferase